VAQPILIAKGLLANTFRAPLIVKSEHLFCVWFHNARLENYRMRGKMGLSDAYYEPQQPQPLNLAYQLRINASSLQSIALRRDAHETHKSILWLFCVLCGPCFQYVYFCITTFCVFTIPSVVSTSSMYNPSGNCDTSMSLPNTVLLLLTLTPFVLMSITD